MAGETNLMPPGTPEKVNTLIFDALAISAVEGECHETPERAKQVGRMQLRCRAKKK